MSYANCIAMLAKAAGRKLTDDEIAAIYERLNKAALDLKSGRKQQYQVGLGKSKDTDQLRKQLSGKGDPMIRQAAQLAADEMRAEAVLRTRQANLQALRLAGTAATWRGLIDSGMRPLEAIRLMIARDFSGRANVESLEQRVAGYKSEFERRIIPTWEALGDDFAGFFQDKAKLRDLLRELKGEDTGNPLAKKGAEAYRTVAEEARQQFNSLGGTVGKLDDWGFPQHHSQNLVANSGSKQWIEAILPLLDRQRYTDAAGLPMSDADMREFLGKAWLNIATDGMASVEPGQFSGTGKRANRHAEHRQIHFKDADSVIKYWEQFGERSAFEILHGHLSVMARDIGFIEKFGPNPEITYRTLRDTAARQEAVSDPKRTGAVQKQVNRLDNLWNYAAGKTKPSANASFSGVADAVANLNVAGKLGGAAIASFFGDKPVMEAVSHLNDLPVLQRWTTELSLLNPANKADRNLLQQQGLMLDSVRSGLYRFYEGLGKSGTTGKLSNAVMRLTGMQAINDIRKGAFGASLMNAFGNQIDAKTPFRKLPDTDIRALNHLGIEEADWNVWRLAELDTVGGNKTMLTPESIARIPDAKLLAKGLTPADRQNAIIKLLGAINTESEFAIVMPGWNERAQFYGGSQRGTVSGEITRSILQFKSFPWAYFQRGMDLVANQDRPVSKAAMTAYLVASTAIAGAMIMQTREVLTGKDPRKMFDDPKNAAKFWGAAFLQGGALGIYGDFLYGINQTRYGSGPLEAMAGPTLGPLLELGIVQPMNAAKNSIDGKETHLMAQTLQDMKGFVPGGNMWYTKAALDHMIWQNVFESLSPGYLGSMRRRTMKDYQQEWWWEPGELTPQRPPDFEKAMR